MAGVKLIPKYENAVAQVKRDEVKVIKSLVEALKLVEEVEAVSTVVAAYAHADGLNAGVLRRAVRACERLARLMRIAVEDFAGEYGG